MSLKRVRSIFMQIIDYMEVNSLFHPNHHGFRSLRSTATAMLQMYDSWVQAVDKGCVTGVCMLDMSAAFDVVNHSVLLSKLALYGFDNNALEWMKDYLSGRSQAVYVDGCLSSFRPNSVGVPQGSIMGLLCYVLFTNELPEIVNDPACTTHSSEFNSSCELCGGVCCFADDSTYSVANKDLARLEDRLNRSYAEMSLFMANNKLKLNDEKTHLLMMTTGQKHRNLESSITINTSGGDINRIQSEKLLGVRIQEDLKWSEYLVRGKDSLANQLCKRLGALKMISSTACFKTRLTIANGIFSSKLIYQISLWGGAESYLIDVLQKIQNRAARFVTHRDNYTPVKQLLKECGWLSVRQLEFFHSTVQLHKILTTGSPEYLFERITETGGFPYDTRLAASDSIRIGPSFRTRLRLTDRSFVNRAIR